MDSPGPDRIRKWAELVSVGPIFGATVAVAWYVGSTLDARFGTSPWLMTCLVIFGVVGSFWKFIKMLQQLGELGARRGRRRGPEQASPGADATAAGEGRGRTEKDTEKDEGSGSR